MYFSLAMATRFKLNIQFDTEFEMYIILNNCPISQVDCRLEHKSIENLRLQYSNVMPTINHYVNQRPN